MAGIHGNEDADTRLEPELSIADTEVGVARTKQSANDLVRLGGGLAGGPSSTASDGVGSYPVSHASNTRGLDMGPMSENRKPSNTICSLIVK
jgi:hypothetical protein